MEKDLYSQNKLLLSRCYLCGAMDRAVDGGVSWRNKITPALESMGIIVFDPANKPINIAIESDCNRTLRAQMKKDGQYDKLAEEIRVIRRVDLRMVDITDYTIVSLDIDQHPTGTYEELFLANREKKPVLVWNVHGKQNTPDWLFGVIPHEHIFSTAEELISYLQNINNGTDNNDYKRWFHFDLAEKTIAALKSAGFNITYPKGEK